MSWRKFSAWVLRHIIWFMFISTSPCIMLFKLKVIFLANPQWYLFLMLKLSTSFSFSHKVPTIGNAFFFSGQIKTAYKWKFSCCFFGFFWLLVCPCWHSCCSYDIIVLKVQKISTVIQPFSSGMDLVHRGVFKFSCNKIQSLLNFMLK